MANRKSNRSEPGVFTYQTRVSSYDGVCRDGGDSALSEYADLFGRIKRSLFAKHCSGEKLASLKTEFIAQYGIPARLFNSARVSLEGNISSIKDLRPLDIEKLKRRISKAEKQIEKLLAEGELQQVHQRKRRLGKLNLQLASLKRDVSDGKIRICFGSKRLWKKQNNLEANGYQTHDDWREDWQSARSDEVFLMGSKDEKSGCQLCVASVQDDGSLSLRLRLPNCLIQQHGKYLYVTGVKSAYGHEHVLAALTSGEKTR